MVYRKKALDKARQDALTPQAVLNDLMQGNLRFVTNNTIQVDHKALIEQTASGQFPKAVILSCIDSRVPVEIIFDQAFGDVFVARVAGNFENQDILGSLEYSCKVAGSKLILVLGHENCGAVNAACDGVKLGNITAMLDNIMPAVKKSSVEVKGKLDSSNKKFVNMVIATNVKLTIERIRKKSPILKELEDLGDIMIVGGVYGLKTGKVEFF